MNFKFSAKKAILAFLLPAVLLAGCSGNGGSGDSQNSTGGSSGTQASENTVNAAPSDILKAVMDEVTVSAAATKDESELDIYYKDIDASKVESAALCLSVGHPDEIAIIKFKTDADAKAAETVLKNRIEEQINTFKDYDTDNMYKLESAKVYSSGCYAVLLAVDDNDKAKSIVDEKLAG